MQNQNNQKPDDGIVYLTRIKTRVESKSVPEGLSEMFDKTFKEMKSYFDKMVREKKLLSFHAFGDWDNGINTFHLDIFGGALPDPEDFTIIAASDAVLDLAHFTANMYQSNADALAYALNEIKKANITGKWQEICVEIFVPILDLNYICKIVWTCDPFSERHAADVRRAARNN